MYIISLRFILEMTARQEYKNLYNSIAIKLIALHLSSMNRSVRERISRGRTFSKNSIITSRVLSYKLGAIQFKNFMQISKPIKQAAFAGKARSITGTTPL